ATTPRGNRPGGRRVEPAPATRPTREPVPPPVHGAQAMMTRRGAPTRARRSAAVVDTALAAHAAPHMGEELQPSRGDGLTASLAQAVGSLLQPPQCAVDLREALPQVL